MRRAPLRSVALLALVAAVSALAPACASGGGYEITASFERAIALYDESDVKVLGLPAGRVTEVETAGDHVEVTLRIDDDVPLPADVRATIVPASLIGERYIQLFPAWTEGDPRLEAGGAIPLARTSIPVEPDEALAALKEFIDTLDPDATGRLVQNLSEDLRGVGSDLNRALEGLGTLATTLAAKDGELVRIIEHFDTLSATLVTRERQLGNVLEGFATTANVLAEERRAIEALVDGLAGISVVGLQLVDGHAERLDRDLEILGRTLQSVSTHMDAVTALLDAGPLLVAGPELDGSRGLAGAYHPEYHHIDLRTSFSPTLTQALGALGLGGLPVCIPADVECSPQTTTTTTTTSPAVAASAGAGDAADAVGAAPRAALVSERRAARRSGDGADSSGPFGWLRRSARSLVETLW